MSDIKIGFIGAGKMATALAQGLLAANFSKPASMIASDTESTMRQSFTDKTGIRTTNDNSEVVAESDLVILAIKPQVLAQVLSGIESSATEKHLFISIIAGAKLETLEQKLSRSRHIRVMPNTPALVQAGASGFAPGSKATAEDIQLAADLLSTVGIALQVPEHLLDAVTGLSGSGPAYAFEMIESLSDGGVLMGLPRHIATQLAAQTLMGAAKMVLETGEHPGVLKDAVTSPGGTTIAGLHALETGGMRGVLMNAVRAATNRSRELG